MLDDLPSRRLEVVDPPDDGHRVGDPDGIRAECEIRERPTSEIDPRLELVDLPARDRQSHQMVPALGQRPHASLPGGQDVGVVGEVDRRSDDLACRVRRRAAGARKRPGGDHRAEHDRDDRSGRPQADEEGRPPRTPVAPATGLDGCGLTNPHAPLGEPRPPSLGSRDRRTPEVSGRAEAPPRVFAQRALDDAVECPRSAVRLGRGGGSSRCAASASSSDCTGNGRAPVKH